MKFLKFNNRDTISVFSRKHKKTFNYDVSGLGAYVDDTSKEIMEDLIETGDLKSRIVTIKDVKGSKEIKLKTSSPTLQAASSCGWNATGGIVLTDKAISTVRVKIQEEYCNEDLNDTWAQIENAAGANTQDEKVPNFAKTMIAYYKKRAQELDENLMMNGDTTSLNPNLVFYDGFSKLWDADTSLNVAYLSTPATSITAANGYDALMDVYNAIPTVVKANAKTVGAEILVGYETARACIDQVWNDKDYNAVIDFKEEGDGSIYFTLPTTTMTVRSLPSLNGTDKVYGVCYNYMFYGTDLENDRDGFAFKYSDYDEKLRFGVKWRSGIQYVFSEYFTRLKITAQS